VGLLVGAASVSFLFGATPFLIPAVAERFGVSLGSAGLISTAQVSGFALATFVAGRRWRPSRRKLAAAAVAGAVLDAGSALSGSFPLLLALRAAAGASAGVLTWLAWAEAMRDPRSMRDVAAIGPLVVVVAAPLLGWLASFGGDRAVYWALAVASLSVVPFPIVFETPGPRVRRRMSPARSNLVLIAALGIITMAGSGLFVFAGAFAEQQVGLSPVALSAGFSINALAGLVGARWRWRPAQRWPWVAGIGLSAAILVAVPHPAAFYGAMILWGFTFWMAIPGVLLAIAEWSFVPDERVGDAQSVMAIGRAAGPAVGGLLLGSESFGVLGAASAGGLAAGAVLVGAVEHHRKGRPAPVRP
jgi:DHA1 family inner membrane transport protein